MSEYAAQQLREQSKRGPYAEDDFYRLRVVGNGTTNWVNITQAQLDEIVLVLEGNWTALATKAVELAREQQADLRNTRVDYESYTESYERHPRLPSSDYCECCDPDVDRCLNR